MQSRHSSFRLVCALSAVTVLAAACVKANDPDVAIRQLEANIVFGVKDPDTAAPANTGGQVDEEQLAGVALDPPSAPSRPPLRISPLRLACPDALRGAFPLDSVQPNVPLKPERKLPQAGSYRWKRSGTTTLANIGEISIAGFEQRQIKNVQFVREEAEVSAQGNVVVPEGMTFTYDTVQNDLAGALITTSYRVRTNAQNRMQDAPVDPLGGDTGRVIAGEPDRGLVLQKIESASGDKSSTFQPILPLLLLPLPVRAGEQWQSVAIDPRTLTTLTLLGNTVGPERIDACGEIIEGFRVNTTLTSSTDNIPITYNYIVATQYGAVIISETIKRTLPSAIDVTFTQGQRVPSPLEAK